MFKRLLKLPVFLILALPCLLFDCLWIFVTIVVEFGFEAMYTIVDGENHNKYDDFAFKHGPNPGLLGSLYDWWAK